jgi:hypothetical protein
MSTIINATTTNGVVIQPDNSGSLVLQTNSGTTALTISTAQNATFAAQATIPTINLTGGQITFPATQSASANANTLDDYEEGTWTPVYSAGTINGAGKVYSGTYTKIGRLVTVTFKATSTDTNLQVVGYVAFTGLPFTAAIDSSGAVTTEDIDVFARNGFCQTISSTASFYLSACGSAGGTNALFASTTYSI